VWVISGDSVIIISFQSNTWGLLNLKGENFTLNRLRFRKKITIFIKGRHYGAKIQSLTKGYHMTKISFASHPFLLGFEQLDRLVERTAKSGNEGYPPYNIEQSSDTAYRITLAVAGFRDEDLSITLEDSQLVIRGRQVDDSEGRVFLHRGIAARQFQRSFVLADGVEVAGANLENGLLHVDLQRSVPNAIVQKIEINKK
jgi:HSP20 family molecular chaperone IbpA